MEKNHLNNLKPKIEHVYINVTGDNFNFYFLNLEAEFIKVSKQHNLNVKSIYLAGEDLLKLSDDNLIKLLTLIKSFIVHQLLEYSFECWPQVMTNNQLMILKRFNINRLVWKVFTFQQKLLTKVNSHYQSNVIVNNIEKSNKLGFCNFSLDLKYNIFNQSTQDLIKDLEQSVLLNAAHISYDSFTEQENKTFKTIINQFLQQKNYYNYEFFSYIKDVNFQAQQTLAILNLQNWYGLGPDASSFINDDKKPIILKNDQNRTWKTDITTISKQEYYQLILIQGLMLKTGITINKNNVKAINYYKSLLNQLISKGLLISNNNNLRVTNQGWILLNEILTVIINNK